MNWFNFLKEGGYFNPENNPEPIKVNDGFQIPYWESLSYLEKISLQIKDGKELNLTDELISIIKNISLTPKDNYRTWYILIKIVSNLPNAKISKEILHFIPTWLSSKFESSIQSSELCEKLLPKFLTENPSKDDIEKAEIIIKYLFEIEKKENIDESSLDGESFYSKINLYYLSETFIEKKLIVKVAQYCSNEIVLLIATNIKRLFLDYPKGINISLLDGETEVKLKVFIEDQNLSITYQPIDSLNPKIILIEKYEELNDEELKTILITSINILGINYNATDENEEKISRIIYALNNDFSSLNLNSIKKLGDRYHHDDRLIETFSWILRDLLSEKAKHNPIETISLLKIISQDRAYRLPFFKRIALYVISENWLTVKSLFWDFTENVNLKLFSNYRFNKDLFELLSKNQKLLSSAELSKIETIINEGPQDINDNSSDRYPDHWKFRWYAALSETEKFKELYNTQSIVFNKTSVDFEDEGVVKMRSGSVPPFTKAELLEMENQAIVDYIYSFKPNNRWEEPTISGLADSLQKAIAENPQKFANEIILYNEVYYIYAYHIISGFKEAWSNKKEFDWLNVLSFCKNYLLNEKFYSEKLSIEYDGWGVNSDWVVGIIGNLLSEGTKSDSNSFKIELLPLAKEIIFVLTNNLKEKKIEKNDIDFPTYSLNSSEGKVLRALLDYSLLKARHDKQNLIDILWEEDIKILFDATLKKDIIDGYIIEGMYFQQFYFLDKIWITNQVKQHYQLEEKKWRAFIGGFAFGNPPFNKEIYELMYPHYERAIDSHFESKAFSDNGIIRHIVAFYFWGYEDLNGNHLIKKFLGTSKPNLISELIRFVWMQEDYYGTLNSNERIKIEKLILSLWQFILNKYKDTQIEEEKNILSMLPKLITFVSKLDETNSDLIRTTMLLLKEAGHTHNIIEKLSILKDDETQQETANRIAQILNSMTFRSFYFSEKDNKHLIAIISFLFENQQKDIASQFCNKLMINGNESLREVYLKYNP